jgi:hypothetical protein
MDAGAEDQHRDELPADLDATGYVGPYKFPDNSRRRIPGVLYLGIAAVCVLVWALWRDDIPYVNDGWLWAALALTAAATISITSGWRMHVTETDALVAAQQAVRFPVGHASAQQVWRGLRSRPTWRVLCYSVEDPPRQRGLVLVDAVDGTVIEHLVESNPEAWSVDDPAG